MNNVIAELRMPVLVKDKAVIECPQCEQYDDLTLIIDSDDYSETASYMRCDAGHTWAEPRFPRRMGAELLARKERDHPETIDWSAVETRTPRRGD